MKKGILVLMILSGVAIAGAPVWTFTPLTATNISVSTSGTATVEYTVTNQSRKSHTLSMNLMRGVSQDTSGSNCKSPFTLGYGESCTLKLIVTGSQLTSNISGGPVVCEQVSSNLQCYQPSFQNRLIITTTSTGVTLTAISPATSATSGGTGVTLTGTDLTGATSVTFDGSPATSVNVVNSTTVTAVTPAHAAGAVNVVVTTPSGSATLTNGYTYATTAPGQPAFGGTVACLNGGSNDLIAATTDNSTGIVWAPGLATTGATSTTNGAANTALIVAAVGPGAYAAKLCSDYEVDSQGNTPCRTGNTCYNDWFLPAGYNTGLSGQLNCLYTNREAIGGFDTVLYWSSTENLPFPSNAFNQSFDSGGQGTAIFTNTYRVRCVRAFTP